MSKTGRNRAGTFSMRRMVRTGMGPCFFCGDKAGTLDHYIPVGRGGSNDILNLVAACEECNIRKANRLPQEFFEYCRQLLIRRPLKQSKFMEKARATLRNLSPELEPKPGDLPSAQVYDW